MDRLAERLKNLTPLQRAVVALKETQARLDALEARLAEPIAIVGMACRFPGGAVDPQSYWRLLIEGRDAIGEVPPDRWDVDRFHDPDPAAPGKMCSRWGGFLAGIDQFDNHFFGISDREAARIDPQQRLLLELAWEALEDAGLPPSTLRGTKTGVFIGISASEYGIILSSDISLTGSHAAAGTSLCLAANRISFALGLQGPSLAVDTACSSSLVALHMACQSIHAGECDMALAGGANLLLSPLGTINLTKSGFCAADGRVRAFDAAATGYVRSEGAAIVALRPLSAALKNRDPIHAIIRASAVNQNGGSNGLTAPSRAAQEQVLRAAYARAKISPGQVRYVETQGTGTRLGDAIEAQALGSVLAEGRKPGERCAIGAVKTNIGHTEAASGMAGLMKAALALKHGQMPANLHFQTPNPEIPFDTLPLRVLQACEPWPNGDGPRVAGVSALGFGGSNAHVVLEEAPAGAVSTGISENGDGRSRDGDGTFVLPLSARTDAALRDLARRYIDFLDSNMSRVPAGFARGGMPDSLFWRDLCHTAAMRRDHHDLRLAIVAAAATDARTALQAFIDGQRVSGVFSGRRTYGRKPKICADLSPHAVAKLYAEGADVAWENFLPAGASCLRLPTYPWQRKRHWIAPAKWSSPAAADSVLPRPPEAPPHHIRPDLIVPYVAPRSALEKDLAAAWSAVLDVDDIGIHDNFFELGGDSLQATVLLNRLREERADLGDALAGHVLFEAQTIADLAAYIGDHSLGLGPNDDDGWQKDSRASEGGSTAHARSAPLSLAQQRLWLLDRLDPENAAYNIPLALRLSGPIDTAVLDRAMTEIVARHETLRTRIELVEDQPRQVISPPAPRKLPLVDFSDSPAEAREAAAMARAEEEARRPFHLNESPLFRAELLRVSATEHILVIVMHHVIGDDWSMGVLFTELAALYRAFSASAPSPLPPLTIQYADHATRQREALTGDALDRLLGYWRERLAGLATLELPTDRPRPPQVTHAGAVYRGLLPAKLAGRIKELGRREGATLYMTLLAAFEVLLYRYSGQTDFAIGSPIAARPSKDAEGLIGFLANTLAMRADLAGEPTFRETLRRVRRTALDAFKHQEMPLEALVEALNPPRDTSRHPLFQVLFTLQNAPWPQAQVDDLTIDYLPVDNKTAKFDLWLSLRETPQGLQTEVEYNTALFDAATIERMAGHFATLLEAIAAGADQPIAAIPILTETERRQIFQWNDTGKEFVGVACLHQLVEAQAARAPDAMALDFEGRQLTYAELNRSANRLARYLARYHVQPDVPVGVCLERSPEMVVALLAVLKAGGAYLPLDPDYPPDRLGFTIADSRPAAILTMQALAARLAPVETPLVCLDEIAEVLAAVEDGNLDSINRAEDVAYVIYTSGSTGRPKGVRNTHRGIVNRLLWMQEEYRLTADDRVLQKTPFSFDVSVWEFFWPLLAGARLVLAEPGGHKDPRYLVRLIERQQITALHFVPSMLAVFLEEAEAGACRSLQRVFCSGEALSYELQQRFFARLSAELHNLYGPTEAAVDATYWRCCPNDARIVPIGRPIANMECWILDNCRNPLPVGCPGELHLGGIGLARDYLNRPELTAEKFIPHPFSERPGARLYRTGDLCRWLPDGNIEFLGRLDFQVKIRGNRIELGEIESALDAHAAVRQSVVVADLDAAGSQRLVAYFVLKEERAPSPDELRAFLSVRLPEFMIPAAFLALETMPLTSSGKIDRKALPAVELRPPAQVEYVAPRNETERRLAEIWREVLHVERLGVNDNFFSLGGHSLLAAQVVSRIARMLQAELPLRDIFQSPTIAELSARVDASLASGCRELGPAIVPVPRGEAMLPSFTQEALWFLDQLERGRATYTIYSPLRIQGRLNVSTVERALNEIVRRHEALRTRFPAKDGRPIQVIEGFRPRPLPLVDLAGLPRKEAESRMREGIAAEMERPIDLENGPLIRITMYRMADDEHVAMVGAHHMVYDGQSMAVLLKELTALYAAFESGGPSPLEELAIQYADFAAWQRAWLGGERMERLRGYWFERLAGVPPLELPLDHPRPGIRTTRGATREFDLPPATAAALLEFCRREGVTPFMALLAAFEILLKRHSGQEDFAVGTPVANRERPETEALIGYFVNVVVLRSDVAGEPSFREVLQRLRRTALDAYDHQAMTLDQVVAALNPPRDTSRHPLFQAMFTLQNIELPRLSDFGLSMSPPADGPAPRSSYFDLTLAVWQNGADLHGEWNFSTELFETETIDRMAGHYATLLAAAIDRPDEPIGGLPLLTAGQREQILVDWNRTALDYPRDACVHDLVAARAEESPETEAVVMGDERCTYAELNRRANQFARYLRKKGLKPETRVGICLDRGPRLLTAVLAVLKAGAAYVPLDPAYARDADERLNYILDDAQVAAVITTSALARGGRHVPARRDACYYLEEAMGEIAVESSQNLAPAATAESLAYILYTSGSTGRPKGVMVTHRNLVNAYHGWRVAYRLETDVRTHLQMASFGFDVFAGDMLRALCSGGRLVICPKEILLDPSRLVDLIGCEKVDCAEFVPVVMRNLVQYLEETGRKLDSLRLAIVGSDAWYVAEHKRAKRVLAADARFVNSYGLTETTIDSSYFEGDASLLHDAALVPIGRPFANVRLYILDGRMEPVPVGVPGDLYIGGDGVARGYVNEELNAGRFVRDPFSPEPKYRLCRTGDRARWRPDGQVEFLGRGDDQIKIRGFRIEPGEVEEALSEHPALAQAAVVARERAAGDTRLAAYFVRRAGAAIDAIDLKQFLARRVPDYMVPSAFVALDALPTTSSGKVDRKALPAPDWSAALDRTEFVAPRPGVEQQLAAIWSEVLGVQRIGSHDNFFDLGGNSLLALRLVARLRTAFAIDLPLVTLFAAPTVASLAASIEKMKGPSPAPRKLRSLVPLRKAGAAPPLFFIHGLGGHVGAFLPLAQAFPAGRPIHGLQARGLAPGETPQDTIAEMAASYVEEIRAVQPHGPYLLAGWSMGGIIALEAARQLLAAGEEAARVALLDTYLSAHDFQDDVDDGWVLMQIAPQLNVPADELQSLPLDEQWTKIAELAEKASGVGIVEIRRLAAACKAHLVALARHKPQAYVGPCLLLTASGGRCARDRRWKSLCPNLCVESASGDHYGMLREPHVNALAERLRRFLGEGGKESSVSRASARDNTLATDSEVHPTDGSSYE